MKRNCCTSLLIILTLVFLTYPVQSQQKRIADEDVIKISTELVQIDVLVTDKNNKPVSGLKREDFELYDNEKLQVITHFSYETSETRQAGADASAALTREVKPGQLNRVLAFVIDTLHMNTESIYRARQMLEDFVSTKMAPGDLVLIFPTAGGSGVYQQFTSDQRVLRGAISRLRPAFVFDNNTPARRGGLPQQVLELLPALAEGRGGRIPQAPGQGGASADANVVGLMEEADVRATLSSLNTLIAAMSKLPGRKISVLVSEGFNALQNKMSHEVTEVVTNAARANVVFYSIDPAGLEPLSATAGDIVAGLDVTKGPLPVDSTLTSPTGLVQPGIESLNNAEAERRKNYFQSQDSLNAIAADTGGKFYRNTNDIKAGLLNLLEENSEYYLLGFQPEKWDGKFHKVSVVVRGRPDLLVSTRRGYMAKSIAPTKARGPLTAKAAEAIEAINSPLVRRDIDLQLSAFYLDDAKQQPVMTALLHVDTSKLKFSRADGKHRTKLEVTGFVLDASGRAIDSFSKTADLNLDEQVYQALVKDGLLIVRSSNVKPGPYQVKVLARESETGFIGTASGYIEIPDFKADRLALSSIFTDPRLLQQDKAGEVVGVSSTVAQRRFSRNGELAYAAILYNAKAGGKDNRPELQMVTRIMKGDRVIFSGQPKPVEVLEGSNAPSRIITGGIMQLKGLAPGDYTLEIIVIDKLRKKESAAARQEIDFSVE